MFRCNRCGKKYDIEPKVCNICKNTKFSEGCCKRPKNETKFWNIWLPETT